ncbi:Thioredoxin [Quadrisphaera granulorum]|uniref:Thioredoxin n=1 Tax=Quadrisphaera granulorum TaxID=317664 RepID=A0A315ZRY7_9ACTN|nr:thioredoxin [Quadrisphaera granulorum]SZE98476.1 Thioredoxin [Quadrisphaera granulorum]
MLVLLAVVVVTVVMGLVMRSRAGRARPAAGDVVGVAPASHFGEKATLVQFSTPTCARCPATARQLDALAARHPGVARLEIDLTERPELAARFDVMQTPTVLVVDSALAVRSRFGGQPRPAEVTSSLTAVLDQEHTGA